MTSTITLDMDALKDHKIITLCGSTKFKSSFEKMNLDLTLNNKIFF